eukprot:5196423-Pleurochrysis_carterae.AAC.1
MYSNTSRMNFHVSRPATAKRGYSGFKPRTGSSDAVQLGQNASSRCSTRRAKFQERGGSRREAMPICGLNDKCCNDALQAGLTQGR